MAPTERAPGEAGRAGQVLQAGVSGGRADLRAVLLPAPEQEHRAGQVSVLVPQGGAGHHAVSLPLKQYPGGKFCRTDCRQFISLALGITFVVLLAAYYLGQANPA